MVVYDGGVQVAEPSVSGAGSHPEIGLPPSVKVTVPVRMSLVGARGATIAVYVTVADQGDSSPTSVTRIGGTAGLFEDVTSVTVVSGEGADVTIERGADVTIEREAVAVSGVGEVESVTSTVKSEVPILCGVPDITPVVESRESPAGKLPLASDQV